MTSVIGAFRVPELAASKNLNEFKERVKKYIDDAQFEIFGNNLVVATYIQPEKVRGLYRAPETVKEDEYQGTIGLVVRVGAGLSEEENMWMDKWVRFGYTDGLKWHYDGIPLRDISVDRIRGTVEDPTKVL